MAVTAPDRVAPEGEEAARAPLEHDDDEESHKHDERHKGEVELPIVAWVGRMSVTCRSRAGYMPLHAGHPPGTCNLPIVHDLEN